MKKLYTAMLALTMVSAIFISCSKDDETPTSNSITILGEFTIGDKTFTDHTFDLGSSSELEGYLTTINAKNSVNNAIRIENEGIDIGNNILFNFDLEVYSASVGDNISMYADVQVYQNIPLKQTTSLYIYSNNATANITKVGDVGGYIEGTFEGDFNYSGKVVAPFYLKGKFKVKRVPEPTVVY